MPQRPAQYVPIADGELGLFEGGKAKSTPSDPIVFLGELKGIAHERGRKPGWVSYSYKAKHGCWPSIRIENVPILEPSAATRAWVRSRDIAYAKALQKGAA
jgi:hypothetical protein